MKLLFMLEDDHDRIRRFTSIIATHHPEAEIQNSRTAPEFIAAYKRLSTDPDLICLDHDLFTDSPDDPDPGDGRDVSRFLTTQTPICPALIHSTNSVAADSMLYSMRDAGWTIKRMSPIVEDWIEEYWYPVAIEVIAQGIGYPHD